VLDNHNYTETTLIALLRQFPYPDGVRVGRLMGKNKPTAAAGMPAVGCY